MQKLMKSFYKSSIITSLILLVIGVLLLFKSNDTIIALSYILGTMIVILGIVAIFNFFKESSVNTFNNLNIAYGFIAIILGVLIVMNPTAIATFIPFIVGIFILVNSALKLTYSMEAKNEGDDVWKSSLAVSIISAACGILILFNPFQTSLAVFKIIGAFISIYAILDIIYMIQIKNTFKRTVNEVKEEFNSIREEVDEITSRIYDVEAVEETSEPKEEKKAEEKKTVRKTVTKKAPAKKTTTKKTTSTKTTTKKTPAKKTTKKEEK